MEIKSDLLCHERLKGEHGDGFYIKQRTTPHTKNGPGLLR